MEAVKALVIGVLPFVIGFLLYHWGRRLTHYCLPESEVHPNKRSVSIWKRGPNGVAFNLNYEVVGKGTLQLRDQTLFNNLDHKH